jgi:hypothetical protein
MKLLGSADLFVTVRDTELDVPSPDPATTYTVRVLAPEKSQDLVKRHTRDEWNKKTHEKERVTDWIALSEDTIDYVLVEWAGVEDAEGVAAPCTREAKVRGLDLQRRRQLIELASTVHKDAAVASAASFRSTADVL